jgi:hypothetical protein
VVRKNESVREFGTLTYFSELPIYGMEPALIWVKRDY